MPCRFANSGTVATSRSASRAILALNTASNFLRDLVIYVLHRLRQSRTLHTLTFGPISGVHFRPLVGRSPTPMVPCRVKKIFSSSRDDLRHVRIPAPSAPLISVRGRLAPEHRPQHADEEQCRDRP